VSAAASAPADTEALVGRDFAAMLRSRATAFGLVIGASIALAVGAALGGLTAAVIAPVGWCAVVLGCMFVSAEHSSERKFFIAFAEGVGLDYASDWQLLPLTPLLGAGDDRRIEHYMSGRLGGEGGDLRCALALYTVERDHGSNHDDRHRISTSNEYTICAVDIEAGLTRFPGIYLYPHKDLLDRLAAEGTMSTSGLKHIEVESSAFAERYDVWAVPDLDEIVVRQLFAPTLVMWLAEHPLQPYFEYSAGTLVVFVRGHLHDAGHLDWLLDASRHLAARFAAEVAEAA
jgi:hypothetical protein